MNNASGTKPTVGGKPSGANATAKQLSRLDQFLHSGDKKHVFAGILIVGAIGAIPWLLFTRDAKHQSHEDYMDKAEKAKQAEKANQAEKARQSRMSSSAS